MKAKRTFILLSTILGISVLIYAQKAVEAQLEEAHKEKARYFGLFSLLNDWMYINNNGASICVYLKKKEYKEVAIYGMSHIGHRLKEELENNGLAVCYGIDRDDSIVIDNFRIYSPKDTIPEVDAIIIATYQNYKEVKELLKEKTDADILFIKDIISDQMHVIWEDGQC